MTTANTVDRREAGLFVLQDHMQVEPADRMFLAGVRVVDPGGDDPWAGHVFDDDADGGKKGTAGDIHPWRFHPPGSRDMGAWSQFLVGVVTGAAIGKTNNAPGVTGQGKTQSADAIPVRTAGFAPDSAFKATANRIPTYLPAFPVDYIVGLGAGTREDAQENLVVSLDPRVIVPNKAPHDEMGTLFCDLSPTDRIAVNRLARAQTMERVLLMPGIGGLKSREGPTRAWQLTLTGQGKMPGLGAAYGLLEAKEKKEPKQGEIQPPQISPGTGPNDPTGTAPGVGNAPGFAGPGGGIGAGGTGYRADADKGGYGRKGQEAGVGGGALFSREAWGPLHCGHEDDQHRFTTNDDSEPINSGHLDVDRHFWYRDKEHDAPLEFDKLPWGPVRAPVRVRAWIRYDDLSVHGWNGESKKGLWRLEAESFITQKAPPATPPPTTGPPVDGPPTTPPATPGNPDPPTTPDDPEPPAPPAPPTTPGEPPTTVSPPAPGTPGAPIEPPVHAPPDWDPRSPIPPGGWHPTVTKLGHGHRYVERVDRAAPDVEAVGWMPMQLGVPGMLAFPQHLGQVGAVDLRYSQMPDEATIENARANTPAVARVISWGAQSGQEWDYTQKPGYSRVPGGTADGGFLVTPPEVDEMDYGDSFAPAGLTRSTTYFGWAPGAYAGFGVADPTNGDFSNGAYRMGWASSVLTVARRSSGSWTNVLQLNSQGNAAFSGTAKFKEPVTAHTANANLSASNSGDVYTNAGAVGAIALTLPAVAGNDGVHYTFLVLAAQNLAVTAQAGEVITVENANSTAGGTATANQIGAFLMVVCAGGVWYARSYSITHAWTLA